MSISGVCRYDPIRLTSSFPHEANQVGKVGTPSTRVEGTEDLAEASRLIFLKFECFKFAGSSC